MSARSRRDGPIGEPMGGNSRKAAVRRNIYGLIKGKDILTVHERGISEIDSNVLEVCRIATKSPSLLTERQKRMIFAVWQKLAEANKLHGIRTITPASPAPPCAPPATPSPHAAPSTPHCPKVRTRILAPRPSLPLLARYPARGANAARISLPRAIAKGLGKMPAQFGPDRIPGHIQLLCARLSHFSRWHRGARGKRVADRVSVRTGTQQTVPYARIEPRGQDTYPPRGENAADGSVSCVICAAPIRDTGASASPNRSHRRWAEINGRLSPRNARRP